MSVMRMTKHDIFRDGVDAASATPSYKMGIITLIRWADWRSENIPGDIPIAELQLCDVLLGDLDNPDRVFAYTSPAWLQQLINERMEAQR